MNIELAFGWIILVVKKMRVLRCFNWFRIIVRMKILEQTLKEDNCHREKFFSNCLICSHRNPKLGFQPSENRLK